MRGVRFPWLCRRSSSLLCYRKQRPSLPSYTTLPFSTSSPHRKDFLDRNLEDDADSGVELEYNTQDQAEHLELGRNLQPAPEIDLSRNRSSNTLNTSAAREASAQEARREELVNRFRLVPASPSFFTLAPNFTDELVRVEELARRSINLPLAKPSEALNVRLRDWRSYTAASSESIRYATYNRLLIALRQLAQIHPAVMPPQVHSTIASYAANVAPKSKMDLASEVDADGIATAIGRRKTSSARAWLVEGEGELIINGKHLTQAFARVHDRESVIWPLKATQRTDRYNVWATVNGGGTTGQAEALTLAIAQALMLHEPTLKNVLREAGCTKRDPRMVERKKPGRLKARKKPAWVKR